VRKVDNLPPSVPLSRNLGALTSWNPLGLSRTVTGLIYLFYPGLIEGLSLVAVCKWKFSNVELCRRSEGLSCALCKSGMWDSAERD